MIFLSCSLNDSKISGLLTDGLQPRTSPSPAARHELRGGRDSGAGAGTSGQTAMAIRMPRQGKTVGVAFPKVEITRISMEFVPWRYIQQIVILYIYYDYRA